MSKKLKVVLDIEATEDFAELKEFLINEAGTSVNLANRHINSILEFVESFAYSNFKLWPSRYIGYNWCSSRTYNKTWVVFFQILDDELVIIRVIHGKLLQEVSD